MKFTKKSEDPTPGEEWSKKKSGESEEKNNVILLLFKTMHDASKLYLIQHLYIQNITNKQIIHINLKTSLLIISSQNKVCLTLITLINI